MRLCYYEYSTYQRAAEEEARRWDGMCVAVFEYNELSFVVAKRMTDRSFINTVLVRVLYFRKKNPGPRDSRDRTGKKDRDELFIVNSLFLTLTSYDRIELYSNEYRNRNVGARK